MSLADFLTETCAVVVKNALPTPGTPAGVGPGQDATGAPARDPYTVLYSGIPCSVRRMSGMLVQRNLKRTEFCNARLYLDPSDLPFGFTLNSTHQLRVPDYNGRVFVIHAPTDVMDYGVAPVGMEALWQVDCEETVV